MCKINLERGKLKMVNGELHIFIFIFISFYLPFTIHNYPFLGEGPQRNVITRSEATW